MSAEVSQVLAEAALVIDEASAHVSHIFIEVPVATEHIFQDGNWTDPGDDAPPLPGDRAVFDAHTYPLLHTNEIDRDEYRIHLPLLEGEPTGFTVRSNAGFWETYTLPGNQFGLTAEGALSVGANPLRWYNVTGYTRTIKKVFLAASTAPVGAAVIVDIHKNGTTIFTTQSNRPQIASGANTGQSTTIEVPTWLDGEYLTMEIDQVGSSTAGADLVVHVLVE
jgi:hypothetical protein